MKIILSTAVFFFCLVAATCAIQVSGEVHGTWSPDNNPYEVTGDLRVPQDSTLIIQPGCYIEFQGRYTFLVDTAACLQANGTETDSIVFTAADTVNGWLGLKLLHADSSSILNYCVIEWGKTLGAEHEFYTHGGGIYLESTDISITHCLIKNNNAWEGCGGGIHCVSSDVTISDNTIIANKAGFHGAGICCYNCDVLISDNIIKDNITYYVLGGEFGGGIYCGSSDVVIRGNIIDSNFSGTDGGGAYIVYCNLLLESNIISNNVGYPNGGGIVVGALTQETREYYYNNLIYNNESQVFSSGIYATNIAGFANNTICNNTTGWMGGGLTIDTRTGFVEAPLLNNIIRGNSASEGRQIYIYGSADSITISYSDIEGGWEGEGNIDADPLFCAPDNGNFWLAANSPCVGSGFNGADMGAFGIGCDTLEISEYLANLPDDFQLIGNYPNPFNSSTVISYDLPQPYAVTLDIYDILGRRVATLLDIKQQPGRHQVTWNADSFSSGVYFYKLTAGEYVQSRKMLLVK